LYFSAIILSAVQLVILTFFVSKCRSAS